MPVLQPFVKIPNAILPIDSSQMLVIRDYAENVKRMLELVDKIDVAVPSEYVSEVIPIKYAKASDIASALNSLSSGGGGTTRRQGGAGGAGSTAAAEARAPGGPGWAVWAGWAYGRLHAGADEGAGNDDPDRQRRQPDARRLAVPSLSVSRTSSSAPQATGEIQVLGQTKIISDERTNSLLIYASKEDMKTIKEIVAKLDVVLAQVLIEAAVIEVDADRQPLPGLQLSATSADLWSMDRGRRHQQRQPLYNPAPSRYPIPAHQLQRVIPSGFSYLMSFGQDLDVAVAAAASDSQARILQRPRIQTSHNEPANIFVGTTRPYPTSSYYGGGAYGGYSSIQQLQIGVTLQVTPLINPDGLVVMDISMK